MKWTPCRVFVNFKALNSPRVWEWQREKYHSSFEKPHLVNTAWMDDWIHSQELCWIIGISKKCVVSSKDMEKWNRIQEMLIDIVLQKYIMHYNYVDPALLRGQGYGFNFLTTNCNESDWELWYFDHKLIPLDRGLRDTMGSRTLSLRVARKNSPSNWGSEIQPGDRTHISFLRVPTKRGQGYQGGITTTQYKQQR